MTTITFKYFAKLEILMLLYGNKPVVEIIKEIEDANKKEH